MYLPYFYLLTFLQLSRLQLAGALHILTLHSTSELAPRVLKDCFFAVSVIESEPWPRSTNELHPQSILVFLYFTAARVHKSNLPSRQFQLLLLLGYFWDRSTCYNPGCPPIHDPPALAFWELQLQVWTTIPGCNPNENAEAITPLAKDHFLISMSSRFSQESGNHRV